jgi:hypothetical protein
MLASLSEHFPAGASWTEPEGGLFIWATLPEYIDTGDLLARALREDVAFVPGQAAYVDGRGRNSMRLNFSGVGEGEIREGIRRIGNTIASQVELYTALTGEHAIEGPENAGLTAGGSGREAEQPPVDSTKPSSGSGRNLTLPESDEGPADPDRGEEGPADQAKGGEAADNDEGADVLPFRKTGEGSA